MLWDTCSVPVPCRTHSLVTETVLPQEAILAILLLRDNMGWDQVRTHIGQHFVPAHLQTAVRP